MRVTEFLELPLNFSGIIRLRQTLERAFALIDAFCADIDSRSYASGQTTSATSITLTKADHFDLGPYASGASIHCILYTTSASAVAASMTKTESDKLPIGTVITMIQSTGAVTITGSGGVTFTNRGVVAGGRTATARKVSSSLWLVDYPALSA